MEEVKKKKWGKEEWIILILIGVFLMILFWPASGKAEKKNNMEKEGVQNQGSIEDQDNTTYKEQMENQLRLHLYITY